MRKNNRRYQFIKNVSVQFEYIIAFFFSPKLHCKTCMHMNLNKKMVLNLFFSLLNRELIRNYDFCLFKKLLLFY